jgi:hypothetical protein
VAERAAVLIIKRFGTEKDIQEFIPILVTGGSEEKKGSITREIPE